MSNASTPQQPPKKGKEAVLPHVLSDIRERAIAGSIIYGTYLETNNGRDALWDAYQEALDLVFYLKQAILEREEC